VAWQIGESAQTHLSRLCPECLPGSINSQQRKIQEAMKVLNGACRPSQITGKQFFLPLPHRVLRDFHVTSSQHSEDDMNCSTAESESSSQSSTANYEPALPKIDLTTKNVITPVGDLPMSPLMDPTFHKRRRQLSTRKPSKVKPQERSELQQWLLNNPYGMPPYYSLPPGSDIFCSPCSSNASQDVCCHRSYTTKIFPPGLQASSPSCDWRQVGGPSGPE